MFFWLHESEIADSDLSCEIAVPCWRGLQIPCIFNVHTQQRTNTDPVANSEQGWSSRQLQHSSPSIKRRETELNGWWNQEKVLSNKCERNPHKNIKEIVRDKLINLYKKTFFPWTLVSCSLSYSAYLRNVEKIALSMIDNFAACSKAQKQGTEWNFPYSSPIHPACWRSWFEE